MVIEKKILQQSCADFEMSDEERREQNLAYIMRYATPQEKYNLARKIEKRLAIEKKAFEKSRTSFRIMDKSE